MKKIPSKIRVEIATGLFLLCIIMLILTIVLSQNGVGIWITIVGPAIAIISFVFSIIMMPLKYDDGSPIIKPKLSKPKTYKIKKEKKPFISEDEWEELELEEEEEDY